jgi:hypothetical protein
MQDIIDRFKELFVYEDGNLIRRVDKGKVKAGAKAGYYDGHGYIAVRVDYKVIMVHRIIWEIHNGPIKKGYYIDHVNGNRSDNRIENLRLATCSNNKWNSAVRKDNKSGCRGVRWHTKQRKWRAEITLFSKPIYLGNFDTISDAIDARHKAELQFFGEFSPLICR